MYTGWYKNHKFFCLNFIKIIIIIIIIINSSLAQPVTDALLHVPLQLQNQAGGWGDGPP